MIDIDGKVDLLRNPLAHPEGPDRVEVIETHKSWVFLTEVYAYKLKKPVLFRSVDHRSLAARYASCQEEVRLNRRLAPDVYLGVTPLTHGFGDELQIDGAGETVDWLVKMRRLPRRRMLDALLARQCVASDDIRKVALLLADFYAHEPRVDLSIEQYRQILADELAITGSTFAASSDHLFRMEGQRLADRLSALHDMLHETLGARVTAGRIVEGHGDLRPSHICLVEPRPVIIDCLEFDRKLRIVDPVDELGFLAMECEREGAGWIGPILFEAYAGETGDAYPLPLIDFYRAYRAMTWARLALWRLQEDGSVDRPKWNARVHAYLELARAHADQVIAP